MTCHRPLLPLVCLAAALACPAAWADDAAEFQRLREAFEATASSGDLAPRMQALKDLSRVHTEECARFLAQVALSDPNPSIQASAVNNLGIVAGKGVAGVSDLLLDIVRRADPSLAAHAVNALGRVRPKLPAATFLELFEPRHPYEVRRVCIHWLAKHPEPEVALAFCRALADPGPERALRHEVVGELRTMVAKQPLDRWLLDQGLSEASPAPGLAELLLLATSCERPELADAVARHVDHPDPAVRASAAWTLGDVLEGAEPSDARRGPALTALAPLLADPDERVAVDAALALSRIGPSGEALAALLTAARHADVDRRAAALGALAALPAKPSDADETILELTREGITHKQEQVRRGALPALQALALRDKRGVAALIDALKVNKEGRLQTDILAVLERVTGTAPGSDHRTWKRWWKDVEDDFEPRGALPKSDEGTQERGLRTTSRSGPPVFYGEYVTSLRVAFVVDRSVSMSRKETAGDTGGGATRLDVCKGELKNAIERLSRDSRFTVVAFGNEPQPLSERLEPATNAGKAAAMRWVEELRTGGRTNVYDSLALAMADPEVDTIYLLTDGSATLGLYVHDYEVLREIRRMNASRFVAIHTIAVGAMSELLTYLAKQNHGRAIVR